MYILDMEAETGIETANSAAKRSCSWPKRACLALSEELTKAERHSAAFSQLGRSLL